MSKLTLKDYHGLAMRTSPHDGHDKVENGLLGLIGETGELVDLYKKWKFQSTQETPLPRAAIINELGDVMWYLEELADGIGTSMNAISALGFDGLDKMARVINSKPPLRRLLLNLSMYAGYIRTAVDLDNLEKLTENMRKMLYSCSWVAAYVDVSIADVAMGNVEKLKKRYPEGFSAKVSMARYAEEYK